MSDLEGIANLPEFPRKGVVDCLKCRLYKKKIKSCFRDDVEFVICTGESIDIENCKRYSNFRRTW